MLTGDKTFTAINIGHACRLLQKGMDVLIINGKEDDNSKPTAAETKRQVGLATYDDLMAFHSVGFYFSLLVGECRVHDCGRHQSQKDQWLGSRH
jgi:hypothetical protein